MASVNKIILLGNCGRDPEVRYLPDGKAVANVTLATSSKYRDGQGQTVEDTQWHRLTFYERLAEVAGEYVRKGDPIYIEGRIKYGKFTNKDGVEQNTCDIIVTQMQLLGSKPQGQGSQGRAPAPAPRQGQQSRGAAPAPRQAPSRGASSGFDDMDDDIPFVTSSMLYDMEPSKVRRLRRAD